MLASNLVARIYLPQPPCPRLCSMKSNSCSNGDCHRVTRCHFLATRNAPGSESLGLSRGQGNGLHGMPFANTGGKGRCPMKWFLGSFLLVSVATGLSRHWTSEAATPNRSHKDSDRCSSECISMPNKSPIKGNFTTYSGERCIFHSPGGKFYEKTKPEKCYTSPPDAIADGCRASRR